MNRHEKTGGWMALLGALVFVCGWSLMALEMLGARLLAPCFGSGIYVWGSVIGVFLLALSLGYYLGGRLSAWYPRPGGLAALVGGSAVCLGLLPLIHRSLTDALFTWWVIGRNGGEQWGALVAAVLLFLPPSLLLGTVSPYAIRLAATDVGSVGEKAGVLYAVSTLGSFLGCMATSFYLILWLGINCILWLHAGALVAVALAFWGVGRLFLTGAPVPGPVADSSGQEG